MIIKFYVKKKNENHNKKTKAFFKTTIKCFNQSLPLLVAVDWRLKRLLKLLRLHLNTEYFFEQKNISNNQNLSTIK